MTLALAVLHLALPWVLRWSLAPDRPRRFAPAVRGGVDVVYARVTIGLGVLAFVLGGNGYPDLVRPLAALWLGLAVAIGVGLPHLMAVLAHRPRRFARFPGGVVRTMLCAAAEEVLWRLAAFGTMVQAGLPVLLAGALSVAGFAVLHVPRNGWRVLSYQLLFGALLTLLAVSGGVLAAALCHGVHNIVVAATTRRRREHVPAGSVRLPPSQAWPD